MVEIDMYMCIHHIYIYMYVYTCNMYTSIYLYIYIYWGNDPNDSPICIDNINLKEYAMHMNESIDD